MIRKKAVLGRLMILGLALVLAFPAAAAAEESTMKQIKERGVIRVGFDTFVPWAMKDKTGQYVGFEIDVAKRLAEDLGVKVEFVPTKWDGIIPALLTGKFDVIIGGMGITEERKKKVDFTIPYEHTGVGIFANKEKAAGFKSLADFNKPEVIIAAKLGTTAAQAAKEHMPKAQLKQFGDEAQAIQEVVNGRAHAMVASSPTPVFQVHKYPDRLFLPIWGTFTKEPIGFALRKGDPETLAAYNEWIKKVETEGWLKERMDYWFGSMDWENLVK